MKKIIFLASCFLLLASFAAVDTDSDGVSDEEDICPRVYSQSATGCPSLTAVVALPVMNTCYREQDEVWIARFQPLCENDQKICPTITQVSGIQTCDPIFPLVLKDNVPFVRGSIFIVGF